MTERENQSEDQELYVTPCELQRLFNERRRECISSAVDAYDGLEEKVPEVVQHS